MAKARIKKRPKRTMPKVTSQRAEELLTSLLQRVDRIRGAHEDFGGSHEVVFNLTGVGTFVMHYGQRGEAAVLGRERSANVPTLEVSGDAAKILRVIGGDLDARKAFLSGGIRVRGNLPLFEQVARRLHIL